MLAMMLNKSLDEFLIAIRYGEINGGIVSKRFLVINQRDTHTSYIHKQTHTNTHTHRHINGRREGRMNG